MSFFFGGASLWLREASIFCFWSDTIYEKYCSLSLCKVHCLRVRWLKSDWIRSSSSVQNIRNRKMHGAYRIWMHRPRSSLANWIVKKQCHFYWLRNAKVSLISLLSTRFFLLAFICLLSICIHYNRIIFRIIHDPVFCRCLISLCKWPFHG